MWPDWAILKVLSDEVSYKLSPNRLHTFGLHLQGLAFYIKTAVVTFCQIYERFDLAVFYFQYLVTHIDCNATLYLGNCWIEQLIYCQTKNIFLVPRSCDAKKTFFANFNQKFSGKWNLESVARPQNRFCGFWRSVWPGGYFIDSSFGHLKQC